MNYMPEHGDNISEKNQHWGSTLDDFLHEEGIYEAAKAVAVTRVISWQTAEGMREL
jgi:hypothetical protein